MPASLIISTIVSGASGFLLGAGTYAAFTSGALIAGLKAGVIAGALGGMLTMVTSKASNARRGGSRERRQQVAESIPARWILGRKRVSGQIVFLAEQPDNGLALHLVIVICEGAIEGLEKLYVDGEEVPIEGGRQIYRDEIIKPAHDSRFRPLRDGDGHIVCHLSFNAEGRNETNLGSIVPDWAASDRLEGLSYVHVTLWQDGDRENPFYRNIPNIEFLVRGIKIALPSTAATGEATPVWTNNAADARYWWYRVRRGYREDEIDRAAYRAARAVCSTQVTRAIPESLRDVYSTTYPQYTIDAVISSDDDAADVEALMDFAWQGYSVEVDGKQKFLPGAVRTPELDITEDWIKERGPVTISPPIQERYNGFTARLDQSLAHNWQETDIPEFIDTEARTRDGEARTADFGVLPYTIEPVHGTWLMVVQARRARSSRIWTYSYLPSSPGGIFTAFNIVPGMTVRFTDSMYGLTNQLAQVVSTEIQPDLSVNATLQEHRDDFFSPALDIQGGAEVIPFFAVGQVSGLSVINALSGTSRSVVATGAFDDLFSSEWDGGHTYRYLHSARRIDRIDMAREGEVIQSWNVTGDRINNVYHAAMSDDGILVMSYYSGRTGYLYRIDMKAATSTTNAAGIITRSVECKASRVRARSNTTNNAQNVHGLTFVGNTLYGAAQIYNSTTRENDAALYTLTPSSAGISSGVYPVYGYSRVGSESLPDIGGSTVGDANGLPIGMCTFDGKVLAMAGINPYDEARRRRSFAGFQIWQVNTTTGKWSKFLENPITGLNNPRSFDLIRAEAVAEVVTGPVTPPRNFVVSTLDDGTRSYAWDFPGNNDAVQIRYSLTSSTQWDDMIKLHQGSLSYSPWESQLPSTANNVSVTFEIRTVNSSGDVAGVGTRVTSILGLPPTGSAGPFRGDWATGVAYKQRDTVRYTVAGGDQTINGLYRCILDHTSSVLNRPPATRWWSLYLQDGRYGEDGVGRENIFRLSATPTVPNRPLNSWGYDRPARGWTDNAQGVTSTNRYLWMSSRQIIGQPNVGDAVPANWTSPVIISSWGSGRQGPPGNAGINGVDGADGADGLGYEYVFAVTATSTALTSAQKPLNTWAYDSPTMRGGVDWKDAAPTVSSTMPYLWRAQRTIMGDLSKPTTLVRGNWEDPPVIISTWGSGVAGADGFDGLGYEYIFAVNNSSDRLTGSDLPDNDWLFDRGGQRTGGIRWHDGAPDVSSENRYLWRAERTVKGDTAMPGTNDANLVKGDWSAPVIISTWGAGVDGADGKDADELEYIFALTRAPNLPDAQNPATHGNSWGFDSPGVLQGVRWYDNARDLNAQWRFLWRTTRKVPQGVMKGDAVTDTWSNPSIVGAWGNTGAAGEDGGDGQGYEYAFAITNSTNISTSTSDRPSNTWTFDRLASGNIKRGRYTWSDGAQSVTSSNRYLIRSHRVVPGGLSRGNTVPSETRYRWTQPVIVSSWGSGVAGADGEDGAGIEYVFGRTADTVTSIPTSSRPDNRWAYDSPVARGSGSNRVLWTDGATQLSRGQVLWRSERSILGSPRRGAAKPRTGWGNWSTPVIIARWGEDGLGVEYIYTAIPNTSSARASITRRSSPLRDLFPDDRWGYQRPGSRSGGNTTCRWDNDLVPGTSSRPLVYVSQRSVPGSPRAGTSSTGFGRWSTPVKISEFTPPTVIAEPRSNSNGVYMEVGGKLICSGFLGTYADREKS